MSVQMSRVGGEAEILCSTRAFPVVTQSGLRRQVLPPLIYVKVEQLLALRLGVGYMSALARMRLRRRGLGRR